MPEYSCSKKKIPRHSNKITCLPLFGSEYYNTSFYTNTEYRIFRKKTNFYLDFVLQFSVPTPMYRSSIPSINLGFSQLEPQTWVELLFELEEKGIPVRHHFSHQYPTDFTDSVVLHPNRKTTLRQTGSRFFTEMLLLSLKESGGRKTNIETEIETRVERVLCTTENNHWKNFVLKLNLKVMVSLTDTHPHHGFKLPGVYSSVTLASRQVSKVLLKIFWLKSTKRVKFSGFFNHHFDLTEDTAQVACSVNIFCALKRDKYVNFKGILYPQTQCAASRARQIFEVETSCRNVSGSLFFGQFHSNYCFSGPGPVSPSDLRVCRTNRLKQKYMNLGGTKLCSIPVECLNYSSSANSLNMSVHYYFAFDFLFPFLELASCIQKPHSEDMKSWVEAAKFCTLAGGHLPLLRSREETEELMYLLSDYKNDLVEKNYNHLPPTEILFIGLTFNSQVTHMLCCFQCTGCREISCIAMLTE